jgi:SNW domain-containing protein 1
MATQLSLPPPKRSFAPTPKSAPVALPQQQAAPPVQKRAPSYEDRCRLAGEASRLTADQRKARKVQLFVPRSLQDFDDGGAFPEIHVAQYPRHLGNPHLKKSGGGGVAGSQGTSSRAIVNVEIDEKGDVSYDAIVKGGSNSDKLVYTKLDDAKGGNPVDITLPTEDEEEATRQRTQAALQSLLATKTALDKPSGSAMVNAATSQNQEDKTQFIKYTPRKDAPGYNPAAATRVIQMVPAQVDPMMPPKHMHIKAPRGPAEDFVPVLHGPPPKLSKEERQAWNIPACISNWKNARGYTIPLDKRLAADGRGLRDETTINSNFGTLSESLYVAEQQARQEVRLRAQVQTKLASQERQTREDELRQLAQQARRERGGEVAAPSGKPAAHESQKPRATTVVEGASDGESDNDGKQKDDSEDAVAARQRERLRQERRKERERELRQESNMDLKRQKLEQDRDISEKMALGVHTGTGGGLAGDVDARLYSQSAGMDSGFGAEDEYNTYSKPLFEGQQAASSIYRPSRGETEHNADEQYDKLVDGATTKFQPDKGFAGAEGGGPAQSAGPRSAPVQFEKGK